MAALGPCGPSKFWLAFCPSSTFKDFQGFSRNLRTFKGFQRLSRTPKNFQGIQGLPGTFKEFVDF